MEKVSFGLLRYAELFDKEDTTFKQVWDNFFKSSGLSDLGFSTTYIVGTINGMEPLMKRDFDPQSPVFVNDSILNTQLLIANNDEEFNEIFNKILLIWNEYQTMAFLPIKDDVKKRYADFKEDLLKIKDIDHGFWFDFAFKELNISYGF